MNDGLKAIPIPPALKNKRKRSAYYRQFIFNQMACLQQEMQLEIESSAGPDVRQKREWLLEGANRVVKMIRRIRYRGRKWSL